MNEGKRMAKEIKLHNPWLIAVWPGMGHVAISAGYYLMAKLGMHILSEFPAHELFDVEHVEVKDGLIRTGRLPRSRLFVWNDPQRRHDIVVFIGEAQPSKGRYGFCHRLIEFAQRIGVERVYTFAAMATQMAHEAESRVFAAATDAETLNELKQLELQILDDGQIGGLNGILLGVAAERGLRGGCLLGEMPHIFAQLPYPKASLAVLKVFTTIAKVEIDFTELSMQARDMDTKLGELLVQMQDAMQQGQQAGEDSESEDGEDAVLHEHPEDDQTSDEDTERIERLFEQAKQHRSFAYELKRELDRLEIYREYEDRFLDLFKKPQ
jgi:proteasome assembly chaperone (PAC2) family protein